VERRSIEQGSGADEQRSDADEEAGGIPRGRGVKVPALTAEEEGWLREYWVEAGLKDVRLERVMARATKSNVWRNTDEIDRRLHAFHDQVPGLPYKDVVIMVGNAPWLMEWNTSSLETQVRTLCTCLIDEGVDDGQDVESLLRKAPTIISLSVPYVASKIAAMRDALPTSDVSKMIKREPQILGLNIDYLKQKMVRLRQIFPAAVDTDKLIESSPQLLKCHIDQTVAPKLEYLQEVFPPMVMARMYDSPPSLSTALTLSPKRLKRLGVMVKVDPTFFYDKPPMKVLLMTKEKWKFYMLSKFGINVRGLADLVNDSENTDSTSSNSDHNASIDHRDDLQPILTSPYLRDRPRGRCPSSPRPAGTNHEPMKPCIFLDEFSHGFPCVTAGFATRDLRTGGGCCLESFSERREGHWGLAPRRRGIWTWTWTGEGRV